jgi:hypothetical protein
VIQAWHEYAEALRAANPEQTRLLDRLTSDAIGSGPDSLERELERQALDTEDPMEVSVDFLCKEPLPEVDFEFIFHRADGVRVYSTSTRAERVALPAPLLLPSAIGWALLPVWPQAWAWPRWLRTWALVKSWPTC